MPRPPHRILICDDDDDVRLHLEVVLHELGFQVSQVALGAEAVSLLSRDRHDLVLLDIVMPGISGIETLRRLKNSSATSRVPVVMLTALDEKHTREGCQELGAAAFLTKPVREHDLVKAILKVILDWQDAPSQGGGG